MKHIACAILSVGLCFYVSWRFHIGEGSDVLASTIAFIAALYCILG